VNYHKNKFLTALTIWKEARGEPRIGKLGVYHVIMNRVKDKRWPNTPSEVCLQRLQFSCWNSNDPNVKLFPSETDPAWIECCEIVEKPDLDPTFGSTHYHTKAVQPVWSKNVKPTVTIGNHLFFKL
jgi:N-acetylmuramoyl-L-alanine amidase